MQFFYLIYPSTDASPIVVCEDHYNQYDQDEPGFQTVAQWQGHDAICLECLEAGL